MVKIWLPLLIVLLVVAVAEEFISNDFLGQKERTAKIHAESVFDTAATSGSTNVSVTIAPSPPSIFIDKPKNKTFENNGSIDLEVRIINGTSPVDRVTFNIDNGANTTLVLSSGKNVTTFSTSFGSHNMTVFANETNSGITNSSTVFFTVNASVRFEVRFTKLNAATTNFSLLNESQLQEITNLTLEISPFGKIVFEETINLTDDNMTDDPIDLDAYINISALIFINDSIFTNLVGTNATLYFYNGTINYTNPRVLRNGAVCPATICVANRTENTTYITNVTGFTRYELESTPAAATAAATTAAEAAAATTPSFPRRGNVPAEGVLPGEAPPPGPEVPQEELPLSKRVMDVTPQIILNKFAVVTITALMVIILLLEFFAFKLSKKKRKR